VKGRKRMRRGEGGGRTRGTPGPLSLSNLRAAGQRLRLRWWRRRKR
jgi:hypothetical protein